MNEPINDGFEDARQGETSGYRRWVLLVTIVGTIVAVGSVFLRMGS